MNFDHYKWPLIFAVLLLVACAPKPSTKPEVEKSPMKVDKPEPLEPPEPVKSVPVKPKPIKPESIKPESVKLVPVKPAAVKPAPTKPEPIKQQLQSIKGQIVLNQSQVSRKDAVMASTVVYFEPTIKSKQEIKPINAEISTQNKRFEPDVLAVTVGSVVEFPNLDRILHNVFSVSPDSEFDLGLYSAGTTKSVTFDTPGIIYVHCNVHHSMQADILVLDTPHFTTVDEAGRFELNGLDNLNGTLKIWHPRGDVKSVITNDNMRNTDIIETIDIVRAKIPKHTNKFGKSYRPTRD